jgi:hypothetical protein
MTRKDYVLLAAHIANGVEWGHIDCAGVQDIADALQSDNDRFDRSRFMSACGIGGDRA